MQLNNVSAQLCMFLHKLFNQEILTAQKKYFLKVWGYISQQQCEKISGSFLSLKENLQHILSLKFLFFGHNVTFQATIEF